MLSFKEGGERPLDRDITHVRPEATRPHYHQYSVWRDSWLPYFPRWDQSLHLNLLSEIARSSGIADFPNSLDEINLYTSISFQKLPGAQG